ATTTRNRSAPASVPTDGSGLSTWLRRSRPARRAARIRGARSVHAARAKRDSRSGSYPALFFESGCRRRSGAPTDASRMHHELRAPLGDPPAVHRELETILELADQRARF